MCSKGFSKVRAGFNSFPLDNGVIMCEASFVQKYFNLFRFHNSTNDGFLCNVIIERDVHGGRSRGAVAL